MHDLATSLGREFYFRFDELGKETKVGVKTRHLSFSMLSDPLSENFDVFGRVKFLRTFLLVNLRESPFHSEEAVRLIMLNLKYVRVLSFNEFSGLDALPDSIGTAFPSLKYLRNYPLPWKIFGLKEVMWSPCLRPSPTAAAYSFLGDCLPASLTQLTIFNCNKLHFSNKNEDHDFLPSLPLDIFINLNKLHIYNCENIGCVTVSQSLPKLASFSIVKCPNFVSFPTQGLPAPNLFQFTISDCNKLESLPSHMNTLLPKLEYLYIDDCPEIESFPEGGMPPSLRTLWITNCHKLLGSPSLASMDMLSELHIRGPCEEVNSFPKEGLALLPPSLTVLELYSLQNVETLECKGLLHLTSLQRLTIRECPKLENMVGERLPASLIKLQIYGCPLLQQRCRMKHLQIWPKISYIRGIQIEGKWFP
ncbi:hypothetical protein VNO77_21895 [Canavalia gladiata]|uniref:Uncharacterized protein n=1 Tax=Canavalia gladiata TaxID=3824 RepID=A0AAN9L528_CANGL